MTNEASAFSLVVSLPCRSLRGSRRSPSSPHRLIECIASSAASPYPRRSAALRDTARAMSKGTIITHAEALRLIDEYIGEKVYLALLVTRSEPDHPENPVPVFHKIGPLDNPLAPRAPRLEPDEGLYQFGGHMGAPQQTTRQHPPRLSSTLSTREVRRQLSGARCS
jgi:hypothetical protein